MTLTGVDNVLEITIVTPDDNHIIANPYWTCSGPFVVEAEVLGVLLLLSLTKVTPPPLTPASFSTPTLPTSIQPARCSRRLFVSHPHLLSKAMEATAVDPLDGSS